MTVVEKWVFEYRLCLNTIDEAVIVLLIDMKRYYTSRI